MTIARVEPESPRWCNSPSTTTPIITVVAIAAAILCSIGLAAYLKVGVFSQISQTGAWTCLGCGVALLLIAGLIPCCKKATAPAVELPQPVESTQPRESEGGLLSPLFDRPGS